VSLISKIGIIGAGNVAKAHITAIQNIKDIHLVGVYDVDYQRAQRLGDAVKTYIDVRELIDDSDAVIIATPNYTHANYAMLAIDKNKHVLCEKPMAISATEAECMVKKAVNSKLCCHIGFNYRFLGICKIIKQLIDNGELGLVLSIDMALTRSSALTRKNYTWRDGPESNATSGALGDLGSHLIDLLYYLFLAEINLANCSVNMERHIQAKEGIPVFVDDYAVVEGMLTNGIHFNIVTSKVTLPHDAGLTIKITGERKEFFYNSKMGDLYAIKSTALLDSRRINSISTLENSPSEVYGWSQSFLDQLENWMKCINHGEATDNATFSEGLKEQKVLMYFLSKNTL